MSGGILFVTYGGGHVNMLLPVIRSVSRRRSVTVLGLTAAGKILERAGIPSIGFRHFVQPHEDAAALDWGRRLAASLPAGTVASEESIAYLGLSYADLVGRMGEDAAAAAFLAKGRQAFLPLGVLRRIIDRVQPEMVVASNSPRAEQAALLVAGERRLRSACLVDLFGIDELPWVALPGYGNVVMVMSAPVRDILVAAGRPSNEIIVTGNPAFDVLADPDIPAAADQWRRASGLNRRIVILFASQPVPGRPQINLDVARHLAGIAAARGWSLVVRPHPNETRPVILPEGAILSDREDVLATVLQAADVVLTYNSTVGLEALLLGRPLVQLGIGMPIESAPYAQLGLAQLAPMLGDVEPAIIRALAQGPGIQQSLMLAGNATSNVVAVIEHIASNTAGS